MLQSLVLLISGLTQEREKRGGNIYPLITLLIPEGLEELPHQMTLLKLGLTGAFTFGVVLHCLSGSQCVC